MLLRETKKSNRLEVALFTSEEEMNHDSHCPGLEMVFRPLISNRTDLVFLRIFQYICMLRAID